MLLYVWEDIAFKQF
uniref:Uncharacterized protein n=1 Tax=Anguilla anguilla TaxID=7936 RepID=A0A0E9TPD3_ANGAN